MEQIECSDCKTHLGSFDWEWAPDGWFKADWYCQKCKKTTVVDME